MLKSHHFFLFVLIFSSCSNSQFKTLTGHWEGSMTSDGKTLEVKIDCNNGKCFFDIPQMGFFAQPFEDIQINGSKIELSVDKQNEIIITGEIEKDKISAAIENAPEISISLHKTSPSPEVYTEKEVSYNSGDIKLSGTLIYPKTPAPHTAVVFIHGSGKMTRETMRNRAYMLVKNGFAALIYDRRGRGKSEGSPEQILPMDVLAGDALAGVEFLKTRNEINKEQIGLFGLSQGGWVAPLCASISNEIAFIITVSAPGITPDKQNEYVVKNMLSDKLAAILANSKVPKNEIENILNNLDLNQKQLNENIQDERKEVVPGFSLFDPVPVWEKITVPVLAIWGEKDVLVPAGESKMIIEKALINADNKDFTLQIFENSNHALKLAGPENKFSDKWEIVAPGSNELIIKWLKQHFN